MFGRALIAVLHFYWAYINTYKYQMFLYEIKVQLSRKDVLK